MHCRRKAVADDHTLHPPRNSAPQLRVICIEMGGIAGIVKPVFIIESQDFHSDDNAGASVTRISPQRVDAIVDLIHRSKFMQMPSGDKGTGIWNDTMFEELNVTLGADQHSVFEPGGDLTQKIRRIAGIKLPGD